MQGNDFVQSLMYARGVTCFSCHDPHGTENPGDACANAGNALCLTCHGPNAQNGPHAASIEQHTHHAPDSAGSACIACHMPKIAETIGDVNVRSHTFRFRLAGGNGDTENSERVQSLSHGQDDRLGDRGTAQLERSLALAFAVR